MDIVSTILQVIQAIAAYLKYRFDPVQIARRDAINKQIAEENGYDSVNEYLGGKDTISLSNFISEFMRRVQPKTTDSASGRPADLLIGILPKQRDEQTRDQDPTEGF